MWTRVRHNAIDGRHCGVIHIFPYLGRTLNLTGILLLRGGRDSLLVEPRTSNPQVAGSNPGRSGGRNFFSRVNLCWLLSGVRSTFVLPQWHVKDPCHSAKSAGDKLQVNTHTSLAQRSRSRLTMPLSGQSVGIYPETSLHATCHGNIRPVVSARWVTVDWSWRKEWN